MSKNNKLDHHLLRRGFDLGYVMQEDLCQDTLDDWHSGKPVLLKKICATDLSSYQKDIEASDQLYASVLNGDECDEVFDNSPYRERLSSQFTCLGSSINQGDDQEVETILFDTGNTLAEDLWVKASWLSFHEEDASLRFRFSFGVDLVEDVAADSLRQHHAAQLTDAIFPESRLITDNDILEQALHQTLNCQALNFVERIIYFNAPNGGAYLHHDRERGHAGVVYAQLSGRTFWLALSKQSLIERIQSFAQQCQKSQWPSSINAEFKNEILRCVDEDLLLANELESFSNSALIHLINETKEFVQYLIHFVFGINIDLV